MITFLKIASNRPKPLTVKGIYLVVKYKSKDPSFRPS